VNIDVAKGRYGTLLSSFFVCGQTRFSGSLREEGRLSHDRGSRYLDFFGCVKEGHFEGIDTGDTRTGERLASSAYTCSSH
jgi:hypothetical protein